MSAYQTSRAENLDGPAEGLTAGKLAILIAYATFVWFCAALYIRFAGPAGAFDGVMGIVLFATTIPGTIPINWIARKLAGLPASQMVAAIAVTSATATMLDGIAMTQFPDLYGPDRLVMGRGAIWLLWAIGVALALSLITSASARGRSKS